MLNAFKSRVTTIQKPTLAARSLPDREKFAFAKEQGNLELLLELVNCDENVQSGHKLVNLKHESGATNSKRND